MIYRWLLRDFGYVLTKLRIDGSLFMYVFESEDSILKIVMSSIDPATYTYTEK